MKEFADDNFKFDENGRKLSKWVENTAGKGEIFHYQQFLLFPQCFSKALFCRHVKNQGLFGKRLNIRIYTPRPVLKKDHIVFGKSTFSTNDIADNWNIYTV